MLRLKIKSGWTVKNVLPNIYSDERAIKIDMEKWFVYKINLCNWCDHIYCSPVKNFFQESAQPTTFWSLNKLVQHYGTMTAQSYGTRTPTRVWKQGRNKLNFDRKSSRNISSEIPKYLSISCYEQDTGIKYWIKFMWFEPGHSVPVVWYVTQLVGLLTTDMRISYKLV